MLERRLPPKVAVFFEATEKYVLSLLILSFAYGEAAIVHHGAVLPGETGISLALCMTVAPRAVYHSLVCLMFLLQGVLLLFNSRAAVRPQTWSDVFVPLVLTSLFLAYAAVPHLPEVLRHNPTPASALPALTAVAAAVTGVGHVVSVWSIAHLGRSFSVLVAMRGLVGSGPYRYVRHPIYFGYLCAGTGLLLASFSIAIVVLTAIHFVLTYHRARLEEHLLSRFSPEYREYMTRTGFLLPKWKSAR
jgi:protein-S-isoprenylcysteine O-methyltransferase Ste14